MAWREELAVRQGEQLARLQALVWPLSPRLERLEGS
jgi:hypothetical protein